MTKWTIGLAGLALLSVLAVGVAGCNGGGKGATGGGTGVASQELRGEINVDGSSTVQPIMSGIAELMGEDHPGLKIAVAESGTGGGFKKFCGGEIDIANASRPIKKDEEAVCVARGIEYIEVPIAFDGLSVVVHPEGPVEDLTTDELKKIWEPTSKVKTWADVRKGLPADKISLYGPGTSSGTFDYFTEAIVGKKGESRSDYQANEHDEFLVQGVAGDKNALGYFGLAYYEQNKDKLKLVSVNGVKPSAATVADGTYTPLSRPLFLYVNKAKLEASPVIGEVVRFVFQKGKETITTEGYVPLPDAAYESALARFEKKTAGSLFKDAKPGMKIEDLLKAESAGG